MAEEIHRCYRTLELQPGTSIEQVKQAYRELVKVWHPDRFPDGPKLRRRAEEKLKEMNLAYERLERFLLSGKPSSDDGSASFRASKQGQHQDRTGEGARSGNAGAPPRMSPPSPKRQEPGSVAPYATLRWLVVLPAAFAGYGLVVLLTALVVGAEGGDVQPLYAILGNCISAIVFVRVGASVAPSHKIETAVSLTVLFSMAYAVLFTIGIMRGGDGFLVGWAGLCGALSVASAIGASVSVYRNEIERK